ncbi:interleukin-27 subunit beta isoform X2 [Mirounga angustirostris]|uniref:interleukin-27 subunit beta isoform X2 n=1 Tax=Mirounga angustirostris TaxID=9716 RepID=UPI00313B61CD
MASRLLLVLALWVGCSPCSGREAPTQPRVQCRASRYPLAVDCSWTLLPTPHSAKPTSFIASYRRGVAAHGESRPCLQLTPEATSCTIPDVQLFSMVPYILNVTAVQPWGSSSSFVPFVPEHIIKNRSEAPTHAALGTDPEPSMLREGTRHRRTQCESTWVTRPEQTHPWTGSALVAGDVKPDPPESVRLRPLPGQRLWVQWEPPRSWPFPEIFSLKYWIRYKHHGSARFRQVGPTEATSFTLRAVRPQAKYCIQVAAQDLTDYGEASDWSLPAAASKPLGK